MSSLDEEQITTLSQSWIAYSSSMRIAPETEPDFWAWEELDNYCHTSPITAWQLILKILSLSDDQFVLENLAAGPLETLLRFHGEKFVNLVIERAGADNRFSWLLAGVWKNGISDSIWLQLQTVLKKY